MASQSREMQMDKSLSSLENLKVGRLAVVALDTSKNLAVQRQGLDESCKHFHDLATAFFPRKNCGFLMEFY